MCILLDKNLGNWTHYGGCKPLYRNQSCGLGYQFQRRQCLDGADEQCSFADKVKISICTEHECPRILKNWTNNGDCRGDDDEIITCGDGIQKQIRECIDGTTIKCTGMELERNISCEAAGNELPQCPSRLAYDINVIIPVLCTPMISTNYFQLDNFTF